MNLKNTVTGHLAQTKRKRFEHLLEQFRSSHMGREELVYRMEQCFVAARSGVAMAANRLYENKLLSEPEEIRYFTLSELKQVLTGISNNKKLFKMVAIRKANRTMAEHAWHAPSPEENGAADHRTTIQGLSGSPGTANGMVRIINTPDEFGKLQKGEVLVSRFTDPVWTPLFSIACAVVCDTGGPLSHAAIVAREYGMPAVLGTGNATSVLKDGDMVTVDGSKGIVAIGKRSK